MFSKVQLPWGHGDSHEQKQQEKSNEKEETLTSILDTKGRTELTLLLATCTETMRKAILATFDAQNTGKKADQKVELKADKNAPSDPNADQAKIEAAAADKAKKELEARQKELSGVKMQELKTASIKHFDAWAEAVLSRVGEVVNSRETAHEQKKEAQPASPPKLPPRNLPDPPKYDEAVQNTITTLYPPLSTPLTSLPMEKRALILHSMLLLLLSLEHYSAYSRILLLHLTTSLHLSAEYLSGDETKVARGLLAAVDMKADEETKQKKEENAESRRWKVGLATVAGAAIIGITGGLAAPLVAAGVGSVMGGLGLGATATAGYLGTMASSTVLVGGLFGAYGGNKAGKMMDEYAKDVEDFAFVPLRAHHRPRKIDKEFRRLRMAICITGWLTDKDEVTAPWKVIGERLETVALRFELEALLNLGNSMTIWIKSAAWSYAKKEVIKRTVFAGLSAAFWPIGLLKLSKVVDHPFSRAKARADKAGEVLAEVLINKAQGERPVTLIGYSMGARVIYVCLQTLAKRKAFGLVENAIMLGTPAPSTAADWRLLRTVVAGRLVNTYATSDYTLAFLYRSSSVQYGVAGLQAIEDVAGIENYDVSDIVTSHTRYRFLTGTILKRIGFEDVDLEGLRKEEEALHEAEKKEEEDRRQAEEKDKKDDKMGLSDEAKADELQKEVEVKNKESMMSWMTEKMRLGGATAAGAATQAKVWYATRNSASMPETGDADKAVAVEGGAENKSAEVEKTVEGASGSALDAADLDKTPTEAVASDNTAASAKKMD